MIKQHSISFYTLGCRLNQSETAVIQRTFEVDGYRVVNFDTPADMVVINTCTVTENGDADTRRLVNKVNRLNPQARIALIGCQSQVQKEKLTELPNVQWVVGNARKMDLAKIIKKLEYKTTPQVITPTIPRDQFTIPIAGIDPKHTRANIKIQDGCDFFCSFCEIPYARGRARSRVFKDIESEAKTLVNAGHQELVITGINVGTYAANNYKLFDVIEMLEQIKGLERIRISSIEPTTIPIKLIEKMARPGKLCRHLHIPLQSGNDAALTAMKRKYTYNKFYEFINHARKTVQQICIGTDVIVGFPTETEEQFQDSMNKLKNAPIDYFHVFSYSQRYLAKSRDLENRIPISTIQKRSRLLRDLSKRKRYMFHESLLGTTQKVLFEQKKRGRWNGLTDHYIRVQTQSNLNLENKFFNIKFHEINPSGVLGEIQS